MTGSMLVVLAIVGATGDGQPSVPDRSAYEAMRRQAGPGADAQVRLALWCEQHGMTAERIKHLAAAVLADPSNALARGLMGLVVRGGKWEQPDDVSREAREDPRLRARLEEYLRRRARAGQKVDDQWKLASWCEENGLKEQAVAHYYAVLRLDPRREAAWRHLGFKKVGNRWVKPEWQAATRREADEQALANKYWKPILERCRSGLAGREKHRREAAEAELKQITDPRAVPMVWAVFVPRGTEGLKLAVRLLGQIDSPASSRALAILALKSGVVAVRAEAIQILRMRDPRDFAPLLIALLRDRIEYEVRPVNGPGSPGELLIKNRTLNVDRVYAPPPVPYVPIQFGDYLTFDAAGLPVLERFLGTRTSGILVDSMAQAEAFVSRNMPAPHAPGVNNPALPPELAAIVARSRQPVPVTVSVRGSGPIRTITATERFNEYERIPIGQMMLEAQKAALAAEQQLQNDVAAIQAWNASIRRSNQDVLQVLSGATGVDLGADRTAWAKWKADLFGYAYSSSTTRDEPPTVVEQVPLAYVPQPAPAVVQSQALGFQITATAHDSITHSCFGAGTPVRTLRGLRPIESLRAGDLVLTQDRQSGALNYRAAVEVYHNPPNATYRVALDDGEAIAATGIHRLWKAGHGWVMTRELKPGDVLRTLGGVATVRSVDAEKTQPVYNLRVAEGESYFVGRTGVLAHDNSTIHPVTEPFDAVAPLVRSTSEKSARPHSMLGR